jgi:hypothetical protein
MPAAVDLVIANGSAVNKTFSLYTPAAGDNSVAMWKLKEGAISAVFPTISVLARATGNKARKTQHKIRVPSSYVDVSSGLTQVGSSVDAVLDVTIPDDFPEAGKGDAVAFIANYVNSVLAKALIRDALPAT